MKLDAYACLVFTARWSTPGSPGDFGWAPGPLELVIPATSTVRARGGTSTVTDRKARGTYFAERVHNLLYGPEESPENPPRRWHKAADGVAADSNGSLIQAWEMLDDGAGHYLTVAHVQLGPDVVTSLASLTVASGPGREWLESSLDGHVELEHSRPRIVSHLLWDDEALPQPSSSPAAAAAMASWTTVEQWQWFLASGVSPDDIVPDTEDPHLLDGMVWLSRDWRALVLRDGIAYVALTPRQSAQEGVNSFHDVARVYVRSIYLDVLLLGIMQLNAIRSYADALAAVHVEKDSVSLAELVEKMEADLLQLRTGLWWRDVTRRGGPASEILIAFQQQHHLPGLYTQIVQDLTDMSRYVQARRTSAEEAERESREASKEAEEKAHQAAEDRQRGTERAIALISFVLLPVTIIVSAASLWAVPTPGLFWYSILASLLVLAVMFATSRTLRSALSWRRGNQN